MKKLITVFLFIICGLSSNNSVAQIKVSEQIQTSKIATQESNKLYFVDFWATWCAPCIHAKKYLGSLQKQFPKDFYIVSLSEENPATVRKFMLKHPTDLAVAIDYDKETFAKHNIRSLPEGILFNADGKKLWEGHPADLTSSDINRFLKQNTKRVTIDEFVVLEAYKKELSVTEIYEPEDDFELMTSSRTSGFLIFKEEKDYSSFEGSLKSILAYLLKSNDQQIELNDNVANTFYKLNIAHDSRKHKNLVKHVLRKLKLKLDNKIKNGDVVIMKLDANKFWDTNQINWGKGNAKYLIGDEQIQADNVTFEDIKYRLSNLLEMPVIADVIEKNTLHDWQIHYKYFQLMQSELVDNYGIKVEKKIADYPVYIIQKKEP